MAELAWRPGAIDAILLAVADDVLETPLLVGVEQGCIVAPYDGGVDLQLKKPGWPTANEPMARPVRRRTK